MDAVVWRRRDQPLERADVNAMMKFLMGMDAKLDQILALLREEDDGGEELDS